MLRLLLSLLLASVCVFALDLSQLTPTQAKMLQEYRASMQAQDSELPSQARSQKVTNQIDTQDTNTTFGQDTNTTLSQDLSTIFAQDAKTSSRQHNFLSPFEYKDEADLFSGVEEMKIETTTKELEKFGQSFFVNKNSTDPYTIPLSDNYLLTTGDKLSVSIYGSNASNFEGTINRNGNLEVPNIGKLKLAGLAFADAKTKLTDYIQKAYPQNNVIIDISEYHTIQVLLTGAVKAPGLYNLPSYATVKDLLIVSKGVNDNGSLRSITLSRDGEVLEEFDAYSLILPSKNGPSPLLRNGDIVFVPHAKVEVSLTGPVSSPGVFELKEDETFRDLFSYAAGISFDANKRGIKLTRYTQNSNINVSTMAFDALMQLKPQNGDHIEVFPLPEYAKKSVVLKGNIVQEGEREMPKDNKLSTLLSEEIANYGLENFFLKNTAFDFALIKRKNIFGSDELLSFSINEVLDGKKEILLKNSDEVLIQNHLQLKENPYVYAFGDIVAQESRYQFFNNMTLQNLYEAVKFKTEKDIDKTKEVAQETEEMNSLVKKEAATVNKNYIKLTRFEGNSAQNYVLSLQEDAHFKLRPFDRVEFFDLLETSPSYKATIMGEVYNPGPYHITTQTTLEDVIKFAGGTTKRAYTKEVEITRYELVENERRSKVMRVDMQKDKQMQIYDDDYIMLRTIPNWTEKQYITLSGEFKFPGKYAIEDGETLADIIERAGGFTPHAYLKGAVFARKSIQELQQKELLKSLKSLKQEVAYAVATPSEGKDTSSENKNFLIQMVDNLEEEAKTTLPIGRVVISLSGNLGSFSTSPYNVNVEDGDSIHVPKINKTVTVLGEVMNPNTFIFNDSYSLDDYIQKAGDLKKTTADKGSIYVIKSNGDAQRVSSGYFLTSNVVLEYGDTIVVPKKIETTTNLSIISAITDITYKLAITAASLSTVGAI